MNPAELPPASAPFVPVKLQKASDALVKTKAELAALPDELHFDKDGKIIEDANYKKPISVITTMKTLWVAAL